MTSRPQGSFALLLLESIHRRVIFERRVRVLAESLAAQIPPGASVLDIGCGDGAVASLIQRHLPSVTIQGIEIAPRPSCQIECVPFDGVTIPYPPESFDVCLFVDVLHHSHSIAALLSEACRVSRRLVLIKDHLQENALDFKTLQIMDWVGNRPHGVVLPYNYQTRAQWKQSLSNAGLSVRDWQDRIAIYRFPMSALFGRRLHFIALLEKISFRSAGTPVEHRVSPGKGTERATGVPSEHSGTGGPKSDAGDLFDRYAASYEEALSTALAPSGEGREHFAEGRVAWLARCLREAKETPRTLLDFGCGDGATTPLLLAALEAESAIGIDVSAKSLEVARKQHAATRIKYERIGEFHASGQTDLAYCNGVFHHIPQAQRMEALALVSGALRVGGLFSFWENSPWSLATRYVMSRCAFDRDAIMLTPPEARSLLRAGGFEILRTDFRFIFPRALRALRRIEDFVYRVPLGTQYQILCRKIR